MKEINPTLESRLVSRMNQGDDNIDLETGLIVASGINTPEKLKEYRDKISKIDKQFKSEYILSDLVSPIQRARLLKDFLKEDGVSVYNDDNNKLSSTVDGFLNKDSKYGNCLGLTSLYTVLAKRNDLKLGLISNDKHVFNYILEPGTDDMFLIDLTRTKKSFLGNDDDSFSSSEMDAYFLEHDFKKYDVERSIPMTYNNRAHANMHNHERTVNTNIRHAISNLRNAVLADNGGKIDIIKDNFNQILNVLYKHGRSYNSFL